MTRLVALVLSLHMNRAGESCFPGTPLLMKQSRLGRSAVLEHLKDLHAQGWLTSEKEAGRGGPRRYIATFPESVVQGIVAQVVTKPSATADDSRTVHEPSANRPPRRTALSSHEDERTEGRTTSPAEPAPDTWLTPYLEHYRQHVGAMKGGRLAAALKPVHDEIGAERCLALFVRWCKSPATRYGPEYFARNWRKADRPEKPRPTATPEDGKDYADGLAAMGRKRRTA